MLGPRSMGEGHKSSYSLQYQHSTKQLISRYESMSSSHDQQAFGNLLESPTSPSVRSPKKEKSPMRQSIRNLFSVLKMVNMRKGKPTERPLSSYRKKHHPILDNHPGINAPPVLRSRSRKLTSSLLYLSRTLSDSSDPKAVWMSCTATLEPGIIVVTGLIHDENPFVHIIELSNCTDVRSLSPQQLDSEESTLLPRKGENDEFKVFEILFEGRPREKFAASSVQERAGWVSAVWDSILPSQDQDNNQTSNTPQGLQPPENVGDLTSASSTENTRPQSLSQRALPPIPVDQKPLVTLITTSPLRNRSQTSSSSVSSSIYPPSRPVSQASSGRYLRSTSPSIANLSQLSVVRQRLAQIETTWPTSSERGLIFPTSPALSIGTRLTTPVPSLQSEAGPITMNPMMRDGSGQSSTADSILDSYGDQSLKLPELTLLSPIASLPELETRDISHPSVQSCSTKRPSRPASRSATSSRFEPVIEMFHDHSKRSYNRMNNLRDDLQTLPLSVASTLDVEGHTNHVLNMVAKLELQTRLNSELLGSIHSKMDKRIEPSWTGAKDNSELEKSIWALRTDVTKDLAHIRTALETKNQVEAVIKMKNVPAKSQSEEDICRLNSKIDGLLATLSDKQISSAKNVGQLEKTLVNISSLIEKDNGRQELQAQQQSETVRYLAELNSWLEALVNHDKVQNHNLSVKLDQLCQDLNSAEGGSTLITDIRHLVQSTVARDHKFAALQASLDGVFATLNENPVETSITRLTALIDHQCQYQEQLVRALGTEIFDEIKGERLRFVEAMKEATAINVQVHVEQFKQELKREVVEMTEEVGRLHQDRQAMQNQIADLFAFYRQQREVVENGQPCNTSTYEGQTGIQDVNRYPTRLNDVKGSKVY
ncbi:hypothetical protein H2248_004646 [Termitomyces sp. 'cryptogamus']|nr:hypothetical protein H2248_004646 [Termitomyces sp. 'cryptogamus']